MRFRILFATLFLCCFAAPASAGVSLVQGKLRVIHLGTNTGVGTGPARYKALPIGQACALCSPAVVEAGQPVTGSGSLNAKGTGLSAITVPAHLIQGSAMGSFPVVFPSLTPYSKTQAAVSNAEGAFFTGGGPGSTTRSPFLSGWGFAYAKVVKGPKQFGGTMKLLGSLERRVQLASTSVIFTTYAGPHGAWAAAGGKVTAGSTLTWMVSKRFYASGTPTLAFSFPVLNTAFSWTTGMATVFRKINLSTYSGGSTYYTFTRLQASGYDTVTSMGLRNIQLVTPVLSHYMPPNPRIPYTLGSIAILNLKFVPEPSAWLLLGTGGLFLFALHRAQRG